MFLKETKYLENFYHGNHDAFRRVYFSKHQVNLFLLKILMKHKKYINYFYHNPVEQQFLEVLAQVSFDLCKTIIMHSLE